MRNQLVTVLAAALAMTLAVCTPSAAGPPELPVKVGDSDLEVGDRLRIRSTVMSVDPIHQTLKIAEKEVRLLDTSVGGQTLKTRLLDEEGKPAEFASFKQGDVVLVLGYGAPDGHVYAMKIRRLDPSAPLSEPASRNSSQPKRGMPKDKRPPVRSVTTP